MGISGIMAISIDNKVNPDLAFFSILLKDKTEVFICNNYYFSCIINS